MTKRLFLILILTVTIGALRTNVVSSQDDVAQREQEARQVAAAKAQQARTDAVEKSQREFFDKQAKQAEANLDRAVGNATAARARANETRFAEMQTSASLLLSLSQKINGELQAGGAQSISVFLFKDLDEVEKTVKALRKAAK
jgi:hypothetical protein